jgi:integrase
LYYFGKDASAALNKYLEERDNLQAGRTPRTRGDGLTIRQMVNRFLTSKKTDLQTKVISPRTWADYYGAGQRLVEFFADAFVADLGPADWERFRAKLAKTRGAVGMKNAILRTRIIGGWAFQNDLIDKPIRFGASFRQPNKSVLRRAKTGSRTFAANDLRMLIDAAHSPLKAMILLGLNCGFGQSDVATLPLEALDLGGGWVRFPRPKTGIDRRAPLWPETITALKEAIAKRPEPAVAEDAGLVFLTRRGARWVHHKEHDDGRVVFTDGVGQEFRKLLVNLRLKKRGSFYNLRHTFRTEATAVNDRDAADLVMGHVDSTMAANYVERFPESRLHAVVNAVRCWLWPSEKNADDPSTIPFRANAG